MKRKTPAKKSKSAKCKTSKLFENCGVKCESSGHADIMSLDLDYAAQQFAKHHLVLFRGFEIDGERFKQCTERFGSDFGTYAGGTHMRKTLAGDANSLRSPRMSLFGIQIPAHGEMAYTLHPPALIWFFCEMPPSGAGQTTIYDGVEIWKRLSPTARTIFKEKKIKYIGRYPEASWPQIFQVDTADGVKSICDANGVICNFEGIGTPASSVVTEFHAWAYRKCGKELAFNNHILPSMFNSKLGYKPNLDVLFADGATISDELLNELFEVSESVALDVDLKKGDLIMIDNTRFMHGRRGFFGRREIVLRMCRAPIPALKLVA